MDLEQFTVIKSLLEEIKDLLKENSNQPQTKITVVGNKVQSQPPKGLKNDDDFTL
jgi:hypothetical protein